MRMGPIYVPNTTTGPHPANNNAKCCVPIDVGVDLDVATSIIVDIHANIWTTMKALQSIKRIRVVPGKQDDTYI